MHVLDAHWILQPHANVEVSSRVAAWAPPSSCVSLSRSMTDVGIGLKRCVACDARLHLVQPNVAQLVLPQHRTRDMIATTRSTRSIRLILDDVRSSVDNHKHLNAYQPMECVRSPHRLEDSVTAMHRRPLGTPCVRSPITTKIESRSL